MSPRVMVTVGQVLPWATQNPAAPALHMSSAWGPLQPQRLWVSGRQEFGRGRKKGTGGGLLCLPCSSCPLQTWQGRRQKQNGGGRGGLTPQTALNFCSASCSLQRALECSEECLSNDLLLILFSSDFIAFTGKYEITKLSYPQIYTEMKCFLLNGKIALFV